MAILKQSTAYTRTFLMVDSSDHLSPKTGLTVGVWLSKAGAAFTAVSGSVSELSFGWYKVALNTTDTNTLGELAFHCTGSAADLTDFVDQVNANIFGDTLPANVVQINGLSTNDNLATLKLKQLNILNASGDGIDIIGNGGDGIYIQGGDGNGISIRGDNGDGIFALGNNGISSYGYDNGIYAYAYGNDGIYVQGNTNGVEIIGVSSSLVAPQGMFTNIVGNITGSVTGNVYGDIHGYVGWVTGSVQNVLVSTPAAPPTGTVNANVIQWVGNTPNLLISGTVDAFAHYISPDAITSIWSNATRTLTSFGTLVADIWAAIVDSSGVTTLLSRLTAGRATNLDNLDDAISNVPTANENADAFLKRDWTAVTGEASRSVLNALRFIRNKFSTTAHVNKVTIYKEDDTTEAYQKDVTTDATADPIVEG